MPSAPVMVALPLLAGIQMPFGAGRVDSGHSNEVFTTNAGGGGAFDVCAKIVAGH